MACDHNNELPTLNAERIELADGRYLIYYTFEEDKSSSPKDEDE